MIQAEQITLDDKQRWNKLLMQSIYPSYRQSIEYENSKEINNRKVTSFLYTKNGEDIAGVHYSIKYSRFLKTADILSGFVFKYEPTKELLEYIIDHFIAFAKANNAAYIRISPWLPQTIKGEETDYKPLFNNVFKERKFDIINEGRHTYWIDLKKKTEQELLSNMDKQSRKRVRQGIKSNLRSIKVTKYSKDSFESFWRLYSKLGNSKGFSILTKEQMRTEINSLLSSGYGSLFFIMYNNIEVFSAFTTNFGVASTLYSAVNHDYKKHVGSPPPGQYAYWQMIRDLKNTEISYYDLGFCPGPIPQKNHSAYGIWNFKYSLGPNHVQFTPTYGKAIKPIRGRLFKYIKYKK